MFEKINKYLKLIDINKININDNRYYVYTYIKTIKLNDIPDSENYGFKIYNQWSESKQNDELIFHDKDTLLNHILKNEKEIRTFGGQEHYVVIPSSNIFYHINSDLTVSLICHKK